MTDDFALLRIIDQPSIRRLWLLWRALECVPLEQAIELARAAEAFITDGGPELVLPEAPAAPEIVGGPERVEAAPDLSDGLMPSENRSSPKCNGMALSSEQREQLLDRLAAGATNTELADAFALTSRQVQGLRIGAAPGIAKRPDRQVTIGASNKRAR